ncbi:MAG: 2-oxoglutarate dehydrogenase E1 component [Bacteroidales bacterium]|nr:2-oxoglutarate dehydrogenase E1 component [Bacteroidales bacterium]
MIDKLSYLSNAEHGAIEQMYQAFIENPETVEPGWRQFFEGFEFATKHYSPHSSRGVQIPNEFKVINLINDYRQRGHLFTKTNPVRQRRTYTPTLDIENYGLSPNDLGAMFEAGSEIGLGKAGLSDIIQRLQEIYCQSIGSEYMFIRNKTINRWLQNKIETSKATPDFSTSEKRVILQKLAQATLFEKFIHRKFTGQKRFSLEGAESLIPALDAVIEKGADLGTQEFVIGMAHRGRLNVLANIMKKPYYDIFNEFANKQYEDEYILGDVKYHLGYTSTRKTASGKSVTLSLCPNPSHLEAVNPVVEGIVRSRIDQHHKGDFNKVTPILIHGDASIAGQGIVYEVLQISGLEGYKTGGTIHLVINNQIGFTTNYLDARTSIYCTDVAKTVHAPVFHVNGDDMEALVFIIKMAMEFRATFHKDIFIDILCYRKYGHNEGDEPRFTQPVLYKIIEKHPDPFSIYSQKLFDSQALSKEDVMEVEGIINQKLESALTTSQKQSKSKVTSFFQHTWQNIRAATALDFDESPVTAVDRKILLKIGNKITEPPANLSVNRKLLRLLQDRRNMLDKTDKLDWAMGELLAYGALLNEGVPVRLSGQDVQRGTFSHRHSVLTMEDSEEKYIPLNHIGPGQSKFEVYNSLLSEYGVLGFEYGYALATPKTLTIWEAQFGDFNNGAQVIIDQYICCAEEKWKVMNDLVLLLPHGYEGQGPEHSNARLERFLSLCADLNMQVANCTTPANFFHLLRRQLCRDFRKPLIVFTPKSLLRHPECVSSLSEFTIGGFREVIGDHEADSSKIRRVLFCSGKIYYELLEERRKENKWETTIIRIEQLYPFPEKQLNEVLKQYSLAEVFTWVQEEPANMGAWTYMSRKFKNIDLLLVARPESGSPATGSVHLHNIRQRKIVEKAFGECNCSNINVVCKMVCAPKEWRPAMERDDEMVAD